jgi:hypothetical protein
MNGQIGKWANMQMSKCENVKMCKCRSQPAQYGGAVRMGKLANVMMSQLANIFNLLGFYG